MDFGIKTRWRSEPRPGWGGRRPRRIRPQEVGVYVRSGRWGPKRLRVEHCRTIVRAEFVYRELCGTGAEVKPDVEIPVWINGTAVTVTIRPNSVWRRGRLFLKCPRCLSGVGRLYVPCEGLAMRCRRCWGLAYSKQLYSYRDPLWRLLAS